MSSLPKCDCLIWCGDDPWLTKGKAEYCDHFKQKEKKAALLEVIRWTLVADQLPDADETVLGFFDPADSEPVWLCFLDGEQWRLADGMPTPAPVAWSSMPSGPRNTPWMKVRRS